MTLSNRIYIYNYKSPRQLNLRLLLIGTFEGERSSENYEN
jgi:hypothetical protein